jgi:hypothetical protein
MFRRLSYVKAADTFIISSFMVLAFLDLVLVWYLLMELALLLLMLKNFLVFLNLFAADFLEVVSFYSLSTL